MDYELTVTKAHELLNKRRSALVSLLHDKAGKSHEEKFFAVMSWVRNGGFTDSLSEVENITAIIIGYLYLDNII